MNRLAAIDIGTNTILMLVADVGPDGALKVVRDEHVIARLGRHVDEHGLIQHEAFERIAVILQQYRDIGAMCGTESITAFGTSALRDAVNRQEFIDFIRSRCGISVGVLSGDEEAELTFRGTVSGYSGVLPGHATIVLDIGGGSTEIVVGHESLPLQRWSRDIGAVRLTERFLKSSPPIPAAVTAASAFVRGALSDVPRDMVGRIIAVAGTPTTLAAINLCLESYDRTVVEGHELSRVWIESMFNLFRLMSVDEIRLFPAILPQRADILLAGIIILLEVLDHLRKETIIVSNRGLRYGIILREYEMRNKLKP